MENNPITRSLENQLAAFRSEFLSEFKAVNARFDHVDTKIANVADQNQRLERLFCGQQDNLLKCREHSEMARAEMWKEINANDAAQARKNGIVEGEQREREKADTKDYYKNVKLATMCAIAGLVGSGTLFLFIKLFHVG